MRRRDFLGAALPMLAGIGRATAGDADAGLGAVLDRILQARLRRSPEWTTTLGLDRDSLAGSKWQLDDRSVAAVERARVEDRHHLELLAAIDRRGLSSRSATHLDAARYDCESAERLGRWRGTGKPYVLDQHGAGAYLNVPNLLADQHRIETRSDAEAYLARLEAFPNALDQETERTQLDASQDIIPPTSIIATTVQQLSELAGAPAAGSRLVRSIAERAAANGLGEAFEARAATVYETKIVPALARQIAALETLRARATEQAGIWRLRDGETYYAAALRAETTTSLAPDEAHRLGLEVTQAVAGRLDEALRAQGLTEGGVGSRLRALFADPRFRYEDNPEGRRQMLADMVSRIERAREALPRFFGTLPKADLIVKRVPAELEAGTTSRYDTPSLDGSRPGIFWANLRDTEELPGFLVPTLVHHEALPGHHLQFSLAYETDLPMPIRVLEFTAYVEGWAVYAEQLADELGLYDGDPWGRIGYLHDALLRAVRLVVDTGLHAKRWSREDAIRYMADYLGDPTSSIATEVDRYCVTPGQACSYMLGKLTWLRLRDRAQRVLSSAFDIRAFHDTGLLAGPLPLEVLERVMDDRILMHRP